MSWFMSFINLFTFFWISESWVYHHPSDCIWRGKVAFLKKWIIEVFCFRWFSQQSLVKPLEDESGFFSGFFLLVASSLRVNVCVCVLRAGQEQCSLLHTDWLIACSPFSFGSLLTDLLKWLPTSLEYLYIQTSGKSLIGTPVNISFPS